MNIDQKKDEERVKGGSTGDRQEAPPSKSPPRFTSAAASNDYEDEFVGGRGQKPRHLKDRYGRS